MWTAGELGVAAGREGSLRKAQAEKQAQTDQGARPRAPRALNAKARFLLVSHSPSARGVLIAGVSVQRTAQAKACSCSASRWLFFRAA